MKDVRPWTYAALFGTLWGALEATLGTAVHLGKLPFRGTIMGLAGLLCLVCLLSLIHISEPTRLNSTSRMPSSA